MQPHHESSSTPEAPRPIDVLVLATCDRDYAATRDLIQRSLSDHQVAFLSVRRGDGSSGASVQGRPQVCLLLAAADRTATLDRLARFREAHPGSPVVLLAPGLDGATAVRAMKLGASDCLVDPLTSGSRLVGAILEALAAAEARRQAAESTQRLLYMATTDELTGLCRRAYFLSRAEQELERAERYGDSLCIALLDLDHFKRVNDRYGHAQGDAVLESVGRTLRKGVRSTDLAARLGGEEFCILLPRTSLASARRVVGRLRSLLGARAFRSADGALFTVTASGGLAQHRPGETLRELLDRADRALYRAKERGRDRLVAAA